jgi:hypothetical protein
MELEKNPDRMTLELCPLHGGAYTQLVLSGPVYSSPISKDLHELLSMFALWNGYPVDVVLHVDTRTAGWCEVWTGVLAAVPERHLEVRFQVTPSLEPTAEKQ